MAVKNEVKKVESSVDKLVEEEIKNIKSLQFKSNGLAIKIAACIARMADTADGVLSLDKKIVTRLREEVGISKATAYSSLAVATRYGDPLTKEITGDYANWGFRALLECKDMSDAEIKEAGFTAKTMIKDILAYKKGLKGNTNEVVEKEDIDTTATEVSDNDKSAMQTEVSDNSAMQTEENVSRETSSLYRIEECICDINVFVNDYMCDDKEFMNAYNIVMEALINKYNTIKKG